eukprot:9488094-Pyramimonas_sp.AAC.1
MVKLACVRMNMGDSHNAPKVSLNWWHGSPIGSRRFTCPTTPSGSDVLENWRRRRRDTHIAKQNGQQ